MNNSIKLTKEGSIAIILQRKHDVNEEAVVSVKDTGVGIDTDILRRLFQGLLLNPRRLEQALVCIYQKVLSKLMVAKYGLRIISMQKELRFHLVYHLKANKYV